MPRCHRRHREDAESQEVDSDDWIERWVAQNRRIEQTMEEEDVSARPRGYRHFTGVLTMTPDPIASSVSATKIVGLQARVSPTFKS